MSATLVTPKTTSGGEIITHLINATDGEGLHFDGVAGAVTFTPPDLGTKLSMEFILQADSLSGSDQFIVDFGTGGRLIFGIDGSTDKLSVFSGDWESFGVLIIDDLKVHHLVVTVDGTAAILYDNGNEVGTATITSSDVDLCAAASIGSEYDGTGKHFDGTLYRARFWNKTLTAPEVTASYENATVPFADQYGSQTIVIPGDFTGDLDGWDASNTWNSQTNPSNNMVLSASASGQYCRTNTTLEVGKKYRLTYTASGTTSAFFGGAWAGGYTNIHEIIDGTRTVDFTFEFAAGFTDNYFYCHSGASTSAVTLSNLSLVEIGCVADYDLAFANPTQSDQVQDRAGAADGTASSGVTQVTPIEQVNTNKLSVGGTTPLVGIGLAAGSTPSKPLHISVAEDTPALVDCTGGTSTFLCLKNTGGAGYIGTKSDGISLYTSLGATERLAISSLGGVTVTGAAGSGYVSYNDGVALSGYVGSGVSLSPIDFGNTDLVVRAKNDLVFVASNGTGLADKFQASISGTTGVMTVKQPGWPLKNELTNSGFDVWSNSTLENVGSDLMGAMTNNPSYPWETIPAGGLDGAWENTTGWGAASKAVSLTAGKLYQIKFDGSSITGGAASIGTASATDSSDWANIVEITAASNITSVFEASATTTYIYIQNNASGAAGFTLANFTLYEVTPGISSGALAFDSWHMDSGTAIQRQHNDGGTYTKDGSFYALKATGNGKEIYWPTSNAFSISDINSQRFAGRTVTFGAWVKSDDGTYLRVRDGVTANSDSTAHTGDNTWQWLEVTKEVSLSATLFSVAFILDGTAANYISQPMLCFSSAIGAGNYSRPSGEIVNCEKFIPVQENVSPLAADDKILNVEALSSGKIPKGCKALTTNTEVKNSSITNGQGISWGTDSTNFYAMTCNPEVDNIIHAMTGRVPCDSNGDIYQKVTEAGATLSQMYQYVTAIELR